MSALEAQRVRKSFHSKLVLDDISLRVQTAERFVILGPTAAGKSTLLRVLAGLERPDEGIVRIADDDVTAVAPERRAIGLVFQSGALFDHLSTFENLAFPLRLRSMSATALSERVHAMAATFGIEALLDRRIAGLSGGERQRLAIARALLRDPRVLLLDEPLAGLDPGAREPVREALRSIPKAAGCAVLLVTHDHEEALGSADRLAILMDGRITQCDEPDRVYARPASSAIARFLGPLPMNVFHDANAVLGCGAVVIGIRPQDIAINNGARDVDGIVRSCEFAAGGWHAQVQTSLGLLSVRAVEQKPAMGERLGLHFNRQKAVRYDPASGLVL
ncbi:MAG: ABC transporter ATP-binding protein [Candidatus Eremiobacteraeota bacterium]|nr:ABC transporter ATP-binding protein [Candidatus Eremiobacteraeota bacterium]